LISIAEFTNEHKDILDYALQNMVRRFGSWVYDHREDLQQEGYIGILQAMKSYDKTREVPENKYMLICAIRSMATYCFQEYKHMSVNIPLDILGEILDDDSAVIASMLSAYEHDLSEIDRLILDKVMQGDYIIDIAKSLKIRKQTIIDIIKELKHKLRSIKYD